MKTTKCWSEPDDNGKPRYSFCSRDKSSYRDRRAILRWASDDAKIMRLVRDLDQRGCSHSHPVAKDDNPMVVSMEPCGVCLSCRARKLLKGKP